MRGANVGDDGDIVGGVSGTNACCLNFHAIGMYVSNVGGKETVSFCSFSSSLNRPVLFTLS